MESRECAVNEKLKPHVLALVLRQTCYTEEEAKVELEKYKYNYLELLKDYMGIKKVVKTTCATANQERYKFIKGTMDINEEKYRMKKKEKEAFERYQQVMNNNKKNCNN